uniref:DNA repair protein REV1 n=1 Tax=Spongospora subterranea TaxID=70186 RepID=A0A0H5QHS7_9EUKA|eukprot:CRZ01207.1 hypothetical protein [Spongospora subterranea]
MSNQDGDDLDLSMSGYMSRKRAKLGSQFENRGVVSTLFSNINIFVNGRTTPSQRTLWELVTEYGGSFSLTMCPEVTHVVATGIANTKIDTFRKSRVRVVRPDWIIECITQSKLISWVDYTVPELITPDQPNINQFLTQYSQVQGQSVDSSSSDKTPSIAAVLSDVEPPGERVPPLFIEPPYDQFEEDDSHDHLDLGQSTLSTALNRSTISPEEKLMNRIGDHRFDKTPYKNSSLPSFTLTDPDFVANYFSQSRLHFIGSWKEKFECSLVHELLQLKPLYSMAKGDRGHILHIDMDCFFASISIRDRPDLKDKPVAVSHSKSGTGEVSTCNYVARSFGVRSGMWMKEALRLCPNLQVVKFEFDKYSQASETIYEIFYGITHTVQVLSCDEALLEIPKSANPIQIGEQIRAEIFLATGCTASVGIGDSILFARLATREAKPNGIRRITESESMNYLLKLENIRDLPGLGPNTQMALREKLQITTIHELRLAAKPELQRVLGSALGLSLYEFCRGIDKRTLNSNYKVRNQMGAEIGWGVRFFVQDQFDHFLMGLCSEVCSRLSMANRFASTISLKIKQRCAHAPVYPKKFLGHGECDSLSKSTTATPPTRDPAILRSYCHTLLNMINVPLEQIRAVGLYISRLESVSFSLNTINNYFDRSTTVQPTSEQGKREAVPEKIDAKVLPEPPKLLAGWDLGVFMELPEDIRQELLEQNAEEASKTVTTATSEPKTPTTTSTEADQQSWKEFAFDVNNIDINVLHELPPDIRMEVQFAMKSQRQSRQSTSPAAASSSAIEKISSTSVKANDRVKTEHNQKAKTLQELKRTTLQQDDAAISCLLSLMLDNEYNQVEMTLLLWRKNCKNKEAFNLALELIQEQAQTDLGGHFKIRPIQ